MNVDKQQIEEVLIWSIMDTIEEQFNCPDTMPRELESKLRSALSDVLDYQIEVENRG